MKDGAMKRAAAAERASALYEKLMALPRPNGMSNNEWASKAGVNTSFFVNVRKGSEPSIGNLKAVLGAVGSTLPEFFAEEAEGRLVPVPTQRELVSLFEDILPRLPRKVDRRAEFLAEAVSHALALPLDPVAIPDGVDQKGTADRPVRYLVRAATN